MRDPMKLFRKILAALLIIMLLGGVLFTAIYYIIALFGK